MELHDAHGPVMYSRRRRIVFSQTNETGEETVGARDVCYGVTVLSAAIPAKYRSLAWAVERRGGQF